MKAEELNRAKRARIEQLRSQKTIVALRNPYVVNGPKTTARKQSETTLSASSCTVDPSDRQKAKKSRVISDSEPTHAASVAEKKDLQRLSADPIAQCLHVAASDPYVNQALSVGEMKRKIQYNAPSGMKCSLCDMTSKKVRIILVCASACSFCLNIFCLAFDGRMWPYRLFHLLVEMD
jgi:hypothetical protein